MVPLCVTCGEGVSGGARCPRCDAPPPAWRPQPRPIANFIFGALGVLCGLALVLFSALFVVAARGGLVETIGRLLLGGVGVFIGAALVRGSTLALLLERHWRHPIAGRHDASAVTRAGRVIAARGGGRIVGQAVTVAAAAPRGIEAFVHYATLRRVAAATYGVHGIARVDLSLAAALLSLAWRGRVAVRSATVVSWSHDGTRLSRSEAPQGVDVRRVDVPSSVAHEELAERTLLEALPSPVSQVAPAEGTLPYRASAPTARREAEAPWVPLPQVVFAMSDGDAGFRRRLRARMESTQAEGRPSVGDVSVAFVAALDGLGSRPLATTLLQEIRRGFELRPPAA